MNTTTNLSVFVTIDPGSVSIDHETVSAQVHEQARQSHQMLQDADSGTVPGERHKELVLVARPDAGSDPLRAATGTFYSMFKKYDIDNDTWNESNAVNDGFYQGVFATDEAEHKIQKMFDTITSDKHSDIGIGGESWRSTEERDPDFFPAISFVESSLPLNPADKDDAPIVIDTLIDMETMLPSTLRTRAKWYMSSKTRGELKKIRDTIGDLILTSNEPGIWHLLGYPVVESDAFPDWPTDQTTNAAESTFLMFGNLGSSVKVSDVRGFSKFTNDPYNEGYKTLKYENKYGVYPLDTTGLILGVMATVR